MTKFILPNSKFCQEFKLYHGKAVFHSHLEIAGQIYTKLIVPSIIPHKIPMTQWPLIVYNYLNRKLKQPIEIDKSLTDINTYLSLCQQFH